MHVHNFSKNFSLSFLLNSQEAVCKLSEAFPRSESLETRTVCDGCDKHIFAVLRDWRTFPRQNSFIIIHVQNFRCNFFLCACVSLRSLLLCCNFKNTHFRNKSFFLCWRCFDNPRMPRAFNFKTSFSISIFPAFMFAFEVSVFFPSDTWVWKGFLRGLEQRVKNFIKEIIGSLLGGILQNLNQKQWVFAIRFLWDFYASSHCFRLENFFKYEKCDSSPLHCVHQSNFGKLKSKLLHLKYQFIK